MTFCCVGDRLNGESLEIGVSLVLTPLLILHHVQVLEKSLKFNFCPRLQLARCHLAKKLDDLINQSVCKFVLVLLL